MNIVQVNSGLGNQLFQYAFCRALQQNQPDTLLDVSQYKYRPAHNGYELERLFCVNAKYATDEQRDEMADISKDMWSVVRRALFGQRETKGEYVLENSVSPKYEESFLKKDNCYFNGYWQTEKYFKQIESELREELRFKLQLSEQKDIELKKEIEQVNSVSLHVRLGDYLKKRRVADYAVCSEKYYENAIKEVEKRVDNPVYYVFSDDVEMVKEVLNLNKEVVYIEGHSGTDSWIDMYLMSCCRHNIIANSTFSWWGAWLNSNAKKIVVAPEIWFRNRERVDIVPETWLRAKIQ